MTLSLTKKESQVLDDVLNYMIDYMQDRCWSTQDKLAFDRIYLDSDYIVDWWEADSYLYDDFDSPYMEITK